MVPSQGQLWECRAQSGQSVHSSLWLEHMLVTLAQIANCCWQAQDPFGLLCILSPLCSPGASLSSVPRWCLYGHIPELHDWSKCWPCTNVPWLHKVLFCVSSFLPVYIFRILTDVSCVSPSREPHSKVSLFFKSFTSANSHIPLPPDLQLLTFSPSPQYSFFQNVIWLES